MEAVPDAGRRPIAQAAPAGDPGATAQFLGQVLPGDAGCQHEDDPGQAGPIRNTGAATRGLGRFGRQERFDDRPQLVRKKGLAHAAGVPQFHVKKRSVLAVPSSIIEPVRPQFRSLLSEREAAHPLVCNRQRIPQRIVFDKHVQVLVFGCTY